MAKSDIRFVMKKQDNEEAEDDSVDEKKSQSPKEKVQGQKKPEAETTMAAAAYIVSIIVPFIGPLAIYFTAQKDDTYTRHHAAVASALSLVSFIVLAALAISIVGLCLAAPGTLIYIGGMLYLALKARDMDPVAVPVFADFGTRFE